MKRLITQAVMPEYATEGAACFDLQTLEGSTVPAGGAAHFSTGLAFEVPAGHVMLVFSRSGHGFKHGVRLVNCVGVIDADYRGEVKVGLMNDGDADLVVNPGDRIAQAMILPVPKVFLVEADALNDTARGTGGFGSTGA
ncbi:dUTP diphosphatase [Microvirga alba]|uniref:dUTP diphosphatase n=1 Tax=Microvirga alba TaxID=2791025 RepID=UPI001AEE1EAA|nr:dUTP diphosphatase [Microvirga alba]